MRLLPPRMCEMNKACRSSYAAPCHFNDHGSFNECQNCYGYRAFDKPANDLPEVLIEVRAAEIVLIGQGRHPRRYDELINDEFCWFVNGDSPAHSWNSDEADGLFVPVTNEEAAGYLAHMIDNRDHYIEIKRAPYDTP